MNNASRNRNHPNHKHEQQILKTDLCHTVINNIQELVRSYSSLFDLSFLSKSNNNSKGQQEEETFLQDIKKLYEETRKLFESNNIDFDSHLHWIVPWRQAISFESLSELASDDVVSLINSFHPKSHKALNAIFNHGLESYMRWYPWRWFSDLVFLGAGGFSAVYAANVTLPYDISLQQDGSVGLETRAVALKVVDEKILNEITVQSKAFLALLFHGMTVCESTGDLMMILTIAEEGNLTRQIERTGETSFCKIADITTRLAFNLASLHDDIGMCHRNIHSENILCVDDDYFMVDFRFSTAANEATQVTQSSQVHYGRVPYIAPEVAKGQYTEKSDVYSLGILMWQLISGVTFPSPEIIADSPDVYRIEWVPGVSRWYQEVTMACLEPLPENRPTAEEIGLIMRKIASKTNKSIAQDEGWKTYVINRRQKCELHLQQFNASRATELGESTTTASRVYTLNEFSQTSELLLVNVPFHHRPFDADSIAFNIESCK